jgi:hypothetical protein
LKPRAAAVEKGKQPRRGAFRFASNPALNPALIPFAAMSKLVNSAEERHHLCRPGNVPASQPFPGKNKNIP